MTGRIRVLIVDDNAAVRRGLAGILAIEPDIEVCAEASGVWDAGAAALRAEPDVAIVDLRLADGSGVDASRAVVSASPGTRVVLLTSAPTEQARTAAALAGADAFVAKQLGGGDLVGTLRMVARTGHPSHPMVPGRS